MAWSSLPCHRTDGPPGLVRLTGEAVIMQCQFICYSIPNLNAASMKFQAAVTNCSTAMQRHLYEVAVDCAGKLRCSLAASVNRDCTYPTRTVGLGATVLAYGSRRTTSLSLQQRRLHPALQFPNMAYTGTLAVILVISCGFVGGSDVPPIFRLNL